MSLSTTVQVRTPDSAYEVCIGAGLLPSLWQALHSAAPRASRLFIITSPGIWEYWGEAVLASFAAENRPGVLFVPPGEQHKRLAVVEQLAEELARAGADRDSLLVAFGGGVIGDITGFLAAIYMRGIAFAQLPSTLLAQVDSSVGGKTGVNLTAGKNLLGSFHQPAVVVADIDLLRTLPRRELLAGLQESVKAAIIRSPSLFEFLERSADLILMGDPGALERVVGDSVRIKAEVVAADERESGLRMILNFGHTLGHAIEAATGYGALLHGEAVGWGSIAALHIGQARGSVSQQQFARMRALIQRFGPLPRFHAEPDHLVALTAADKKARSGRRAFLLPTGIGQVEIVYDVTDAELRSAAESMLAEASQAPAMNAEVSQ